MHCHFSTFRTLQILRENLEEEAIVMKDVPGWKVGKAVAFKYKCLTFPTTAGLLLLYSTFTTNTTN